MSRSGPLLELHQCVDARLAPGVSERLAGSLQADPEAATRVAAWQDDLDMLRKVFDPIAAEPAPLAHALAAREAGADRPIPQGRMADGRGARARAGKGSGPGHRGDRRRGDALAARLGGRQDRLFIALSAFVIGAAAALAGAAAFGALSGDAGASFGAFWRLPAWLRF